MRNNKISQTRQQQILEKLESEGSVTVNNLSQDFDVSPITIRRDLDFLSQKGHLDRTHGGARLKKELRDEALFSEKGSQHVDEKALIGKAAAEMINPGDTIFLNSGSTTLEVIKHLKDKHVRIITNNAAALTVERDPQIELFILGGEYREASQSLVGDMTLLSLSQVYSSTTILGVNGISMEGLTSSVQHETSVNRLMIERSHGSIIVLADSSKLGVVSNFLTSPIENVTTLITDKNADPEIIEKFKNINIDINICE